MNRYPGRVVAITGAAQGLGLAMARRFAAEGATVALADVNEQALTDAAGTITDTHDAKLRTDTVNVTDSAQVNDWIAGVTADLGRLDVLINNAGIIRDSSMSWRGNFGQTNYVAAKAGIVGMTRTLALEGARHGITANAIAPGLIDTPMLASMNGPARDKLTDKVPMRHTGTPEDIAEAAAFLASEAAGYITGIVLDVDGGISIGSSIR